MAVADFLSGIFGDGQGGGQGGGYLSYLDPADQQAARGQAFVNLGAGLLGAAGPSPFPTSVGQGLAVGGPAMMQAMNQYGANAFRGKLAKAQLAGVKSSQALAARKAAALKKYGEENPLYANWITAFGDAALPMIVRERRNEAVNKILNPQQPQPQPVFDARRDAAAATPSAPSPAQSPARLTVTPGTVTDGFVPPTAVPAQSSARLTASAPELRRVAVDEQPQPVVAPMPVERVTQGSAPAVADLTAQERAMILAADDPVVAHQAVQSLKARELQHVERMALGREKHLSQRFDVYRKEYDKESAALTSIIDMANRANDILTAAGGGEITGVNQIEALYTYITALDPASTVREGEISLVEQVKTLNQIMETAISKARDTGAKVIPSDVAKDMMIRVRALGERASHNIGKKRDYYTGLLKADKVPHELPPRRGLNKPGKKVPVVL